MDNRPNPSSYNPRRPDAQTARGLKFAYASLILGLLSIVTAMLAPFPFFLGVFGIAAAYLSRQEHHFAGPGLAGLILSISGTVLSILIVYLVIQILNNPEYSQVLKQIYDIFSETQGLQ